MSLTDDSTWYVSRNGQQIGPLSRSQFQDMFDEGKLAPTDDVWSHDLGEWTSASKLFKFPGAGSAVPPPPPPSRGQLAAEPQRSSTTQTVVEGGSFKFGTLVWGVLAFIIPLWPISLPICLFLAYRSYKKPTVQTVRTTVQ